MFNFTEVPAPAKQDPGIVLLQADLWEEGLPFLLKSIEKNPDIPGSHSNLAIAYRFAGKFDLALECINTAIGMDPNNFIFYLNRGRILDDLGRFDDSFKDYQRAFGIAPGNEHAQAHMGISLMRRKRFSKAWMYWQHCIQPFDWAPGVLPWQGENLEGKRILVTRQGGYGDVIWQWRYLRLLHQQGANITFYGWKALKGLLENHPWIEKWADSDDQLEEKNFDCQIPLMMIMAVLAIAPLPITEPYLGEWKPRGSEKPRVGLCWAAGEVEHNYRKFRSLSPETLEMLADLPFEWVRLQLGDGPAWTEAVPGIEEGFHKTVAAMNSLDLVVTVDSAVAHLAGAMGIPTTLLLPKNSDWKWESAWYLPNFQRLKSHDPYSMVDAVIQVKPFIEAMFPSWVVAP